MENVSYGYNESTSNYGAIILKDGTPIKFTSNQVTSVKRFDERNLVQCKYLNLCGANALVDLDLIYLKQLRVLGIHQTSIANINLSSVKELEFVIYGTVYSLNTQQEITVLSGVKRRVFTQSTGGWVFVE